MLCGPREFGLPTNEAIRLCELFYPYEHMLGMYYDEVNALLEPLQRRRRRRQVLGVWSRMAKRFTKFVNSASAFMFGNDDRGNDDNNSRMRELEDKVEMLEKKDTIMQQQANKTNTFLELFMGQRKVFWDTRFIHCSTAFTCLKTKMGTITRRKNDKESRQLSSVN